MYKLYAAEILPRYPHLWCYFQGLWARISEDLLYNEINIFARHRSLRPQVPNPSYVPACLYFCKSYPYTFG